MIMFSGLRLTQGNLGISADEGFATSMDFENSTWHFKGNIIINLENSKIESDIADIEFLEYQLKSANIIGSPATFIIERLNEEKTTYAEAGKLKYDFIDGIIEFSENAVITEGRNKISSNFLAYNIKEQRINASSSNPDDPRVKITYTPDILIKDFKTEEN